MDDDNGLELSLGLSCGGSSGKTKGNNTGGSSDNNKADEGDKSARVIENFKNFLHPGTQKHEPSTGSQRSDSVTQENFFSDLSKTTAADADASLNRFWVEEEPSNKQKLLFPETSNQKKHQMEVHNINLQEKKAKMSHISITTEDGSTAENEDVAESEVGGSSDVAKEVQSSSDADVIDLTGQRRNNNGSLGEEFKIGNSSYGVSFSVHPVNVTNATYSLQAKDSNSNSVAIPGSVSDLTPPSMLQSMNSRSLPVMFGYSPVQLPTLDKDGFISHSQQFQPAFASRGTPNSAGPKGEGKQHAAEEGSSNQTEDIIGSSNNLRAKDVSSDQTTQDSSHSFDFSAIKPGIAADVKFGGSGMCPNLPWVSTTGSGPHGRTISGVTYRFSANKIRIVCACHGSHMSPEEFVRHASEEYVSPEASVGLTAASAHS